MLGLPEAKPSFPAPAPAQVSVLSASPKTATLTTAQPVSRPHDHHEMPSMSPSSPARPGPSDVQSSAPSVPDIQPTDSMSNGRRQVTRPAQSPLTTPIPPLSHIVRPPGGFKPDSHVSGVPSHSWSVRDVDVGLEEDIPGQVIERLRAEEEMRSNEKVLAWMGRNSIYKGSREDF